MSLDTWQKIIDIALKGIAATILGIGTVWLAKERLEADESKLCADSLDQTFKMVASNQFSDSHQIMLNWRIKNHNEACSKLDDNMVKMLNNTWQRPMTGDRVLSTSDELSDRTDNNKGTQNSSTSLLPDEVPDAKPARPKAQWAAYSRRNDDNYSAINFDVTKQTGDSPTVVGTILKARWFVNIRPKNTPIARGDNPVIGLINGGECVKVLEHVQGTLNEWIRVEQSGC